MDLWEPLGKDTMRYLLTTLLLGAIACGGCEKKPEGPQTTDPQQPKATAGPIRPLEPPMAEGSMEMAPPPAPAPMPTPVIRSTPAPTPLPPTVVSEPGPAPAPEATRFHTVQNGDTLWKIATKVYGSGQRWRDIAAANPGLDTNKMKVGQTLVIPQP